jgi:hypothetical protein
MARPIALIHSHDHRCRDSMDDLYGNAWGDPVNDYASNPTYPPPTWNAQPPSPEPPSPGEDGRNDSHANDDDDEDLTTEPQPRNDAPETSWTTDAVPWPVEENQNQYYSAWAPASPVDVWSSTAQPQTPAVPAPTPSDDAAPESPPPASPIFRRAEGRVPNTLGTGTRYTRSNPGHPVPISLVPLSRVILTQQPLWKELAGVHQSTPLLMMLWTLPTLGVNRLRRRNAIRRRSRRMNGKPPEE